MMYKWLWCDGHLEIANGISRIHHRDMLKKMVQEGLVKWPPQGYIGGDYTEDDFHGPAFDNMKVDWDMGSHPTSDELRYMIQQELGKTSRLAIYTKIAADIEDTEPQGASVGFLHDPHKDLYPNLFRGQEKIPDEVREALKNHVLEPLKQEFTDPDKFIYFTIYGSGISYNWDESGDLDLQLWVDIEKYSATVDDPLPIDDLLADVRRVVQTVNFPSFIELGLEAPEDSKEDTTGGMLIQYYPKPGKGSKDENLASNPYACYDLETGEWLVKPKPIEPKFYGDNFLLLMPKAKDIALQTEALLGEYNRNVLNWQFWFQMYNKYQKPEYREEYRQAMEDATQEKAGIQNLFHGVFGGRAEAYLPGGKGIEDERDMIQKLLEVWGIFQELKHFARVPLPWEEQEMPTLSGWMIEAALDSLPEKAIGPHPDIQHQAETYMQQTGRPYNPPNVYVPVDPEKARAIAQEYDTMRHDPNNPIVSASYTAFINETINQYDHLIANGYKFEFYPAGKDPYPLGPRQAIADLRQNKHLYVYPTESGFGDGSTTDHPLLGDTGITWNGRPVTYNDVFRAVHDVFGHAKEGVGFRADGEDNAWRQHAAMYSELARPAMTSETRGQNSWVNFGPHGEHNQNANQTDTVYAEQKAGIMPHWVMSRVSSAIDILDAGGGTLDPHTLSPMQHNTGYYVSLYGREKVIPVQDFSDEAIRNYLNTTEFNPGEYLGTWVDGDQVYLDVTKWVQDLDTAIEFGKQNKQQAIYDIANNNSIPLERVASIRKFAAWSDIMDKAQRLMAMNGVMPQLNTQQHVIGQVKSGIDDKTPDPSKPPYYTTEIWRDDPNSGTITLWACDCQWGAHSWGRTRIWKKYEGRPCTHTLALYWTALKTPVVDEGQQTIPGMNPQPGQPTGPPPNSPVTDQSSPLNLPNALQQTIKQETEPAPATTAPAQISQPQPAKDTEQMTIGFPGALSKWRKEGLFENGDYVRANEKVDGYDARNVYYVVPRNMIGEVLWSDPEDTIVIFSIENGPLGTQNVKVTAPTDSFTLVPRERGTAPRRHR